MLNHALHSLTCFVDKIANLKIAVSSRVTSVCVAEWLRSPPLMRESLGSTPGAGKLDSGYHPSEVGEISGHNEQWVTAVEDCECKSQVWEEASEERWPRVLDNVDIHFTCGLTAMKRA